MFIEQSGGQWSPQLSWREKLAHFFADKKMIRVVAVVLAVFLLAAIALIYWLVTVNKKHLATSPSVNNASSNQLPTLGRLPGGTASSSNQTPIKAETLYFGDFYHPLSDNLTPKASGLALPTNIKQLAANYYPVDREISLVNAFTEINKNGFAIIDNPYAKTANDFYGVYALLNQKNLSYVVTDDFLLYYYQNALKNIFKTVESEVFYKEFWDINKQLFATADQRYRDRYAKVGLLNDPVLEGLRLEAVYFGTMLEILTPKPKQILSGSKDSVQSPDYYQNFFSDQESKDYSFVPPDYLADTISKEMDLINKGAKVGPPVRSPALLYTRDYSEFTVPKEYQTNAKLNNFYLATKWANSLFPLYYQGPDCPDCLLDHEDWTINQAAAHLIARDLDANQDLKNRWAKIYKVLSFFNNLRSELTYLDYDQIFTQMFGSPAPAADGQQPAARTIEDVFDVANANRDQELIALRDKIAARTFDPSKGGLDRSTIEGKKYSGMRMLQVAFDPTMYVYNQLIYDPVGLKLNYNSKIKDPQDITSCPVSNQSANRCRAFGLDIINAVFDEPIKSTYFTTNTDYQYYDNQAPLIRSHFTSFDALNWHNNLYWTSLDLSRQMLNNMRLANFPYTQTDAWTDLNLSAAEGAMLNAQLPVDRWALAIKKDTGLVNDQSIVKYNYVEPNLKLINELIADSQMVFDVFTGLGIVNSNDSDFGQLLSDLNNVKALEIKELNGDDFYYNDWTFLNEFTGRYYLTSTANKQITLNFTAPSGHQSKQLKQSIDGVKLIVAAYHHQGRDLIAVGPVFNYQEVSN
jgi:hypothetical protein